MTRNSEYFNILGSHETAYVIIKKFNLQSMSFVQGCFKLGKLPETSRRELLLVSVYTPQTLLQGLVPSLVPETSPWYLSATVCQPLWSHMNVSNPLVVYLLSNRKTTLKHHLYSVVTHECIKCSNYCCVCILKQKTNIRKLSIICKLRFNKKE